MRGLQRCDAMSCLGWRGLLEQRRVFLLWLLPEASLKVGLFARTGGLTGLLLLLLVGKLLGLQLLLYPLLHQALGLTTRLAHVSIQRFENAGQREEQWRPHGGSKNDIYEESDTPHRSPPAGKKVTSSVFIISGALAHHHPMVSAAEHPEHIARLQHKSPQ